MRLEIIKNATRNIKVGIINKIITILFPFILRTVIIKTLGTDYLGLSSLFKSVLQVLSLSELGIGSAMIFNMYKPIADGDYKKQAQLLILYRKIYLVIGSVIFIGGFAVLPFIKFFIHGSSPEDVNIYILYIIYILNSSESYFISAYQSIVLSAYQRRDVILIIGLFVNSVLYTVQIFCLLLFKNYYLYVIWLPIFTALENIATAIYVKKHYPSLFLFNDVTNNGEAKKLFGQVRDLFGHKLSMIVTNSVDTIVISAFLGLSSVTIFNNYYYFITAANGVLDILYQAILAGIGNRLVVNDKDNNRRDFFTLVYTNIWIIGWGTICFVCLYQSTMILWMGENLLLDNGSVILLSVMFYVWKIRQPIILYKDASGMWNADRLRPYIEIFVNLIINIILVQLLGINGVIISTIICMLLISFPWETKVYTTFSGIVKFGEYLYICFKCTVITFIIGLITYKMCSYINYDPIYTFLLRLGVCIVIPNIFYLLVFRNNKYLVRMISVVFKKYEKTF